MSTVTPRNSSHLSSTQVPASFAFNFPTSLSKSSFFPSKFAFSCSTSRISSSTLTMASSSKVAVVTGANKGIGLSIVKLLARSDKNMAVILTARNKERGEKAMKELSLPNVSFRQLDVTDQRSVDKLKEGLEKDYEGVDILVQNAGRAWTGDAFNGEIAEKTVDCNFWGVVRVWESLRPLVRARKGRLVNVSSRAGNFNRLQSEELKQKFLSKNATSDDIKDLMTKFVEDVKADRYKENGWARNTYGTSKMGLTAISKCWAREEESHGVAVFSCCPGWVRTDMGGKSAAKSPDEGADTPVWLATTSESLEMGAFYAERSKVL